MEVTVGDEVRVYYHPPGPTTSFVEGVVRRVDVPTLRGRVFVLDVTYEVVLDREQPIKTGYQNYVLYEKREEFAGRIEVLVGGQREPARVQPPRFEGEVELEHEAEREVVDEAGSEQRPQAATTQKATHGSELALRNSGEIKRQPLLKAEAQSEPHHVEVEGVSTPRRTRLISALFRRQG